MGTVRCERCDEYVPILRAVRGTVGYGREEYVAFRCQVCAQHAEYEDARDEDLRDRWHEEACWDACVCQRGGGR